MANKNALTTDTSNLATSALDQAEVTGTDVAGDKRALDAVVLNTVTTTPAGDVEVVQPTHDDLNANVNIQVGDADVDATNRVPVDTAGILGGVIFDYAALVEASTTDTWTFRNGGSGGSIEAVIVITYTDSTKLTISNVERTT